jgi:hypothetical protein
MPSLPPFTHCHKAGSLSQDEVIHPWNIVNKRSKRAYVDDCLKQTIRIVGGHTQHDPRCEPGWAYILYCEYQPDITASTRFCLTYQAENGLWDDVLVPLDLIHAFNRFGMQQRAQLDQAQRDGTNSLSGFQAFCNVRYMGLLLERIVEEIRTACSSNHMTLRWRSAYLNRWLFRHFHGYKHDHEERLRFDRDIGAGWYECMDAARELGTPVFLPSVAFPVGVARCSHCCLTSQTGLPTTSPFQALCL